MEKLEFILWIAYVCCSIVGPIFAIISINKKGIAKKLIAAAVCGLAAILRAITLPYTNTSLNLNVVCIFALVGTAVLSLASIFIEKFGVDPKED